MRHKLILHIILLYCGCLLPAGLPAQSQTLSGIIRDRATGGPLPFANIEVLGLQAGTSAGEDGRFELSLERGEYELQASFIGYKTERMALTVRDSGQVLEIALTPTGVLLQEVTVFASTAADAQVSNISLQSERLREISSVIPDVLRSIQALPGITSNNELSAKFNVRGGNFDENLVLVNGAQVYEPFHVKEADNATVGIFNLDLIRKVDLITGGFSARYGDRASSVLNIEYREGSRERYNGAATLSMTNLDGYLEGPLTSRGAFILGLRKSYLEYILSLLDVEEGARPSFYDVQGVLSFYPAAKHKVLFEFIHAGDDFKLQPQTENIGPFSFSGDFQGEPARFEERRREVEEEKARYFSNLFDIQSINLLSANLLLRGEISYYDQLEKERYYDTFTRKVNIAALDNYFYDLQVDDIEKNDLRIKTLELKGDLDAQLHPRHQLKTGISYQNIRYLQEQVDQSVITERYDFAAYPDTTEIRIVENYLDPADERIEARTYKLAGYAEDVWQAAENVLLSIGGRIDYFDINRDLNFSPRLSASYHGIPGWTLRGAWGHFYQSPIYRQIASPAASDSNTQAIRATHYILSLERAIQLRSGGDFRLRLEGYYKDYDDLIHSELSNDGRIFYSRRNDARGYARGIDLQAVLNLERFYGWISYGLLSAKEDLAGDGRGAFPRYTDQRHTFSFVGDMRLGRNWKLNLRAVYGSGFAYTPSVARFNEEANRWEWVSGEINSAYLPAYRRIDMRLSKDFPLAGGRATAFLDISNMLNFKNIYAYDNRFTRDGTPYLEEVELWPIIPSLGVTLKR